MELKLQEITFQAMEAFVHNGLKVTLITDGMYLMNQFDLDMAKYYKVTIDDEVFDEGLTYREACELAEELDKSRQYYWKTVDVVPMEN